MCSVTPGGDLGTPQWEVRWTCPTARVGARVEEQEEEEGGWPAQDTRPHISPRGALRVVDWVASFAVGGKRYVHTLHILVR